MKIETKERIWAEVKKQLHNGETGGKNFKLVFDHKFQPCIRIFNGFQWQLPATVIEAAGGKAQDLIEAAKQKAIEKSKATAKRLKREREELEKRLDEGGFTLLAGEDTDVLFQGTFRECRANIWRVLKCPRDSYSGLGCYVIVDSNNIEVQSGTFDRDCYY